MSEYRFDSKVFLSPMAGITDRPLRQLTHSFGSGNIISEMVAVNAILSGYGSVGRRGA